MGSGGEICGGGRGGGGGEICGGGDLNSPSRQQETSPKQYRGQISPNADSFLRTIDFPFLFSHSQLFFRIIGINARKEDLALFI